MIIENCTQIVECNIRGLYPVLLAQLCALQQEITILLIHINFYLVPLVKINLLVCNWLK
jgi:hypothetical protein